MQIISIICILLIVIIGTVVDSFQIRSPSIIKSTTRSNGRSSSLLMYDVKIINNKVKTEYVAKIPPGGIILDVAETQGIAIPYSCRAGSCSSCVGKLLKGSVDQSGQIFLTDKQIDDGFVLTCAATALSDCEIEVDIEDLFYSLNPDMVS